MTPADAKPKARRRYSPRLWALLVLNALALALFVFVRLDRTVAGRLGPAGEGVHDLFNQVPGKAAALTPDGQRLAADVKALGGNASITVTRPGYLGTLGQVERSNVILRGRHVDDAALARLAGLHGSRIGGLYLEDTGVTDAGLASLGKFVMLRHLKLSESFARPRPDTAPRPTRITDAGLVHLKGLDHLMTLDLQGQNVTDAGLASAYDLPELSSLYLSGTKIEGRSLSRAKWLPRVAILYLDHSAFSDAGVKALAGATTLEYLFLKQVPLTPDALPVFKSIPRLKVLEITGCGFLDEEVDGLAKGKPKLRIVRQ